MQLNIEKSAEQDYECSEGWLVNIDPDIDQRSFSQSSVDFQYIQIEDPVRRKTNNSLLAGATLKGQNQLKAMRGLILLPEEIDFGVLKEGNTYGFTLLLKNTGVDTCRFKVKQPPPATGIRVNYKPGPVSFNSLPNGKILDWSRLKKFANDKIKVTLKQEVNLGWVENIAGKGENVGDQHFLLFSQCFQKASFSGSLKVEIVW